MQQLGVVDLEQHARDLADDLVRRVVLGNHLGDQLEEALAQHLLLLLKWRRRQHARRQRLLTLDVEGVIRVDNTSNLKIDEALNTCR